MEQVHDASVRGIAVPNVSSLPCEPMCHVERGSKACMRSCRDAPFNFRSWESSLAWALCGIDPVGCLSLDIPYMPGFHAAVLNYSYALNTPALMDGQRWTNTSATRSVHQLLDLNYTYVAGQTPEMRLKDTVDAFSFCFWMSMANALPWLFLAMLLAYLAVSLLQLPFAVVSLGMHVVSQSLAYTHLE